MIAAAAGFRGLLMQGSLLLLAPVT